MRAMVVAVAAAGCVALSGLAMGQGAGIAFKPEDVVKTRQGGMAMVGSIADTMKAAVQSGSGDVKVFEEAAKALAKWGTIYPTLFPDGTQNVADTKAKPEIWSDRAGFEKADAAFVEQSNKLAEAAKSGDKAAFAAAFAEEGKACGGCHRNYKNR